MTDRALLGNLRELIGNPATTETNDKQLLSHINASLAWMAETLRYRIVTDEQAIALVASQRAYPLPSQFSRMLWCEWNDTRLEPTSTFRSEKLGTDWRTIAAADVLTEYAIEGREIIFIPPPSSAAVSAAGTVAMRYIAAPEELGADGDAGLWELDYQVVLYKAAIRWLRSHPSDTHLAMIQGYKEELAELVGAAKRRRMNPH
jgi:hypothetical protein